MTVFRFLTGLTVAVLIAGMGLRLRTRLGSWKAVREFLPEEIRNSRQRGKRREAGTLEDVRRIATLTAGMLFLVLALTGFSPVLFLGSHLSGIMLVIHVTVAPLFAIALSACALLWAHRLRFNDRDWQIVEGFGIRVSPVTGALVRFALKAGFWIILSLSLPLMVTVILGLFPLFGTDGEAMLIRLHGYSALLLLIAALCEVYVITAYSEHTTEQPSKEKNQ